MPFDALLAPPRPKHLTELLKEYSATPVPLEALSAYKQAQLERLAPSFWHQHQTWLPIGLVGSVGCMAASGGLANSVVPGSSLPSLLSFGWLSVMGLLILFGVFRVSAGAYWQERCVAPELLRQLGVPQHIARPAQALFREIPDARLILGELIREQVVLDPYLILESASERVCLGIWDGPTIVLPPRPALRPPVH
jgi:hypothetical protein